LPGIRTGDGFSLYSIYTPVGSIEKVPTDERTYHTLSLVNDMIIINRTHWSTVYTSASYSNDGNPPSGIAPQDAHLDGSVSSFLSIAKPGKSVNITNNTAGGGRPVYFVVDMKYPTSFNAFYWIHRNTTQGLMWYALKLYGTNEYVGLRSFANPASNQPDPDDTQWVHIKDIDFRFNLDGTPTANDKPPASYNPAQLPTGNASQTPVCDIPQSTYRYVKVELTEYDKVNSNAVQVAEFYLSYKP